MPPTTRGFDSPPLGTGGYPPPFIQTGDPGAVGPGRFWMTPAGVLSLRNAANDDWIVVAGVVSTPDLTDVLTEGNDAGALAIIDLADPTNDQDAATKAYVDDSLAAFVPASPLQGAPGTNSTGGQIQFNDGGSDVGGSAVVLGGDASPNNDNGGPGILQGGQGDGGALGGIVTAGGGRGSGGKPGTVTIDCGNHTAIVQVGAGSEGKEIDVTGQLITIDARGGNASPLNLFGGGVSILLDGSNIVLSTLPTSDPGVPGALYQVSGVVMISL
jgi:hypothetical protein